MKRLVFEKDRRTGKVTGIKIDNGALSGDGSCIHISDVVLLDAYKLGIVEQIAEGQNNKTYYRIGNITLVKVADGKFVVFDSYIRGMWIADMFKNYCLYYKYNGTKDSSEGERHIVRICLPKVKRIDKVGIAGHDVALNKYLHDLAAGRAGLPSNIYDYDKKESHHKKLACDNRLCVTDNLTHAEHNAEHKIISRASHQVKIVVNTVEELVWLMDYLKSPLYYNSWTKPDKK